MRAAVLACAAVVAAVGVRNFTAQFWMQRGLGATHYKEYAAAEDCFKKAQSLAPYHWLHSFNLGMNAMLMNRSDEAVKHFARTLALNPNYLQAQFKIAEALFNVAAAKNGTADSPELKAALEYGMRATRLNPMSPEVYDLLGRATVLRAQRLQGTPESAQAWREAETHFQKAIDCSVKDKSKLYNLLSLARNGRGDALGAQKALVRSLEDKPDEAETWKLFWQDAQRSGQYDALATAVDARIDELGSSAAAREELGSLYPLQAQVLYAGYGDADGAEKALRKAVEAAPANGDAWAAFCSFAKAAGRREAFDGSLKALAKVDAADAKVSPQVRAAALAMGSDEKKLVQGIMLFMEALQRFQGTARNPAEVAAQFAWAAEVLAARAQQVPLSPENAGQVYFRVGLAFGAVQDYAAASQWMDKATPLLSGADLQQCLLRKGAALGQSKDYEGAVKAFEQAVANDPASMDARFGLAQTLAQSGQRVEAAATLRELLEKFPLNPEARKVVEQTLAGLTR
jgi:tetratricopeptide (TPR) repeat protein